MNSIYMERHNTKNNMYRFYQMFVTPGLFDDWSLIKEWGRVDSPGTVRKEWCITEQEAELTSQKLSSKKMKNGCRLK